MELIEFIENARRSRHFGTAGVRGRVFGEIHWCWLRIDLQIVTIVCDAPAKSAQKQMLVRKPRPGMPISNSFRNTRAVHRNFRRPCLGRRNEKPVQAANKIKTAGYIVSTLSVVALGLVSWKAATEDGFLTTCLILGVVLSIAGMVLRWISYQVEENEDGK